MKRLILILFFCGLIGGFVQTALNTDAYQYNHKEQVYEVKYRLGKIDDKKLWINYGGCGLFALYLSNYFDSTKVPYQIIYISRHSMRGTPNHVVLKLDDRTYIDSDGYCTKFWLGLYGTHFTEVTKEKLRYDIYHLSWNKTFNRNDTTIIKNALK